MFLNLKARTRDESGSTLIAVVGLVAVAALITTVVTVSTVQALSYTTSTRAGVQAQAAADAGVAYLTDRLKQDSCAPSADRSYGEVYTSAVLAAEAAALGESSLTLADLGVTAADPYFSAMVQYKPILAGEAWRDGCPPRTIIGGLLAYQVRVESTGYAANEGVNGVSALDEHTVEAVYGWSILTVETPGESGGPGGSGAPEIRESGAAVYAHSSEGFAGSGTLVSVDGSRPGVLIRKGNVNCNGASSGIVDIVAAEGNITVNGSCVVSGNVWASGTATVDGGTGVGGSVIANGVTASRPIGGSIWSTGDVTLTWGNTVGGSVTAKALSATGVTIEQNVVANGNLTANQTTFKRGINATGDVSLTQLTLDGKVVGRKLTLNGGVTLKGDADVYGRADATSGWSNTAKNVTATVINFTGGNTVTGTKKIRSATSVPAGAITANAPTPTAPTVPEWIDFGLVPGDWAGFEVVTMSGSCDVAQLRTKLASVTGPVLVDALACNSSGLAIGGADKVALNRDVAIFANKLTLGGSGGFTSNEDSRLWLIQPDTTRPVGSTATQPDCLGNQAFSLGGAFSFGNSIDTLIYSPCRVELASSTVMKGQVYAGRVTINGAAQLKYVKVGLPGVDLDGGASDDEHGEDDGENDCEHEDDGEDNGDDDGEHEDDGEDEGDDCEEDDGSGVPPILTAIGGSLGALEYYRDVQGP
jgi:cytoskeletal protein CcmA (bactofilin family)